MYPVRVTRRFNDIVVRKDPEWKVRLPHDVVKNSVVAIIDERDGAWIVHPEYQDAIRAQKRKAT
jgi:hypothetical protein